jgi:hypothetical protein
MLLYVESLGQKVHEDPNIGVKSDRGEQGEQGDRER